MVPFVDVPWLAVILGTLAAMFIGFLWYGPLFSKMWMREIGKTQAELAGTSNPALYIFTGLAWLVTSYVISLVLTAVGATRMVDAIMWGVLLALGIAATQTFIYTSFGGPNKRVWAINMGYIVVSVLVMSILNVLL
jgi:hypothetical protein